MIEGSTVHPIELFSKQSLSFLRKLGDLLKVLII